MAELKTKETIVSVDDFLDNVENDIRRIDGYEIRKIMEEITGEPAKMWGPSIIGFGKYSYKYESGHGGEMCKIGFSPRKAELVLYIGMDGEKQTQNLEKLGPHKIGKGCLYIKTLGKIDIEILRTMIKDKWDDMCAKYG